ncbi:MAG: Glu-tRNA(Gln) amidotransferase subunit GatD [Candidatus Caldarchaeum sp.]|nr:Glu-tRNA(Gln) amidotransferase subunit GatD [Candidatus Caldarchaeum sp.]MDW8359121.1 Glu-tRNA(Gln) amidotransferase subunit GatD [Candidatus Caldarchaeum sp.]
MAEYFGYSGLAAALLREAGASVGEEVEVRRGGQVFRGYLMARYEFGEPGIIVLKMANGYNIGVRVDERSKVVKLTEVKPPAFNPPPPPTPREELPRVSIISTGGTIASRIDYRTGGVRAALSAADLVSIVPEIGEIANISAEILMQVYSENLTPAHWTQMAIRVDQIIRDGFEGAVIAHGTDTMGYTAAALSFALQKTPIPVVLVGAQRSSDRPSSDAATNLIAAVEVASKAPFGEVVVCMHGWHSDDLIHIHRGTRVVKLHTSSRGAFQSVNAQPMAVRTPEGLKMLTNMYHPRNGDGYVFQPRFDDRAMLVKFYPGMKPESLEVLVERLSLRGLVLEGTGLGHVASSFIPVLRKLTGSGLFVGMTSQCRHGWVNMNVYDNGRDLMRAGVVPLEDMLAETALVKLMWVLGKLGEKAEVEEVREMMLTDICGEIGGRTMPQQ